MSGEVANNPGPVHLGAEIETPSPDGVRLVRLAMIEDRPVLTPPAGYRFVVSHGARSMAISLEREVG